METGLASNGNCIHSGGAPDQEGGSLLACHAYGRPRLGESRSRRKWLLQRRSPGPEAGSRLCLKVRTFGLRPSCNSCLKRATLGNLHVCGGALETRAWRMACCRLGPSLKRVLSGAVLACCRLCSRRDSMLQWHSMERAHALGRSDLGAYRSN